MTDKVIGITDWHGLYDELQKSPPNGYQYHQMHIQKHNSSIFPSPVKGVFGRYDLSGVDMIESVIGLVHTKLPWVHSLACLQESVSFSFLGLPTPKALRVAYANHLFSKSNCLGVLFWSQSGLDTLKTYGEKTSGAIVEKAKVVYPSVRFVDSKPQLSSDGRVNVLFSGEFFRKGGANVLDAFEQVQKQYTNVHLRLCCDEELDFRTPNTAMRSEYLSRIKSNPAITMGRVPRDVMMGEVLPQTDVYLLPTYSEAFGYAVLEAMAYGIPVIATDHMAIPEMVEDGESGLLVKIQHHDYRPYFRGYQVDNIPQDFMNDVTTQLTECLGKLVESSELRQKMGDLAQEVARTKFSVETRNKAMQQIYQGQ